MVWDRITIKNGATVLVMIIVFTTPQDNIESELLDVPISAGTGPKVAKTVLNIPNEQLKLEDQLFLCKSTTGLHLRSAALAGGSGSAAF